MTNKREAKAAAKYEKRLRKQRSNLKAELLGARISRVGLWCILFVGWLFLPSNGKKIARIKDSLRDVDSKLREIDHAKYALNE